MKNFQFNRETFNTWYNSTTSIEDFAQQLSTEFDTKVSVGLVRKACAELNLDLRKRKKGNRITFSFTDQNDYQDFDFATEDQNKMLG